MHKLTIDFDSTYTCHVMGNGQVTYMGDDGLWVESRNGSGRFYCVWAPVQ